MGRKAATKKQQTRQPDNGLNLGAIHWLALEIEQAAMEVYVTHPGRYADVLESLRETVEELRGIGSAKARTLEDDEGDCPDGWIECDGLCVPICPS